MRPHRPYRCAPGLTAFFLFAATCTNDAAGPQRFPQPAILAAEVSQLPGNVLGALVSITTDAADSALVQFHLTNVHSDHDSVTPLKVVEANHARIPVLGLLPQQRYTFKVVAFGAGGITSGDTLELVTGALPSGLSYYTASGDDPSPGYVVFAAGQFGVVIDNTGRVVWYHEFPNGPGLNFMPQANGRYVARPPTPDPTDVETWIELNPLGEQTRSLGCALGFTPRPHDLIANRDGSYWVLCDESRIMDLSQLGGIASARVTGTVVQRMASDGHLAFNWTPFDHFSMEDLDPAQRIGAAVNWTHGNAIDIGEDGNLLLSFRNLNEIAKIDSRTGQVLWRLGGRANQFKLAPESQLFKQQHALRVTAPDQILLLDNMGGEAESRVEQWTVDAVNHTARTVGAYGSSPKVLAPIGGSVQRLPGGRTLVSFGVAGRVEEYDEAGVVRWRLEGTPGYVFRAQRINSLYDPGLCLAR